MKYLSLNECWNDNILAMDGWDGNQFQQYTEYYSDYSSGNSLLWLGSYRFDYLE